MARKYPDKKDMDEKLFLDLVAQQSVDGSVVPPPKPIQSQEETASAPVTESVQARPQVEPEPEISQSEVTQAQPDTGHGKVSRKDYEAVFLKKRPYPKDKMAIYIHTDTKEQLNNAVFRLKGKEVTLTMYIENILRHHIETYREDVNYLHRKATAKGIL